MLIGARAIFGMFCQTCLTFFVLLVLYVICNTLRCISGGPSGHSRFRAVLLIPSLPKSLSPGYPKWLLEDWSEVLEGIGKNTKTHLLKVPKCSIWLLGIERIWNLENRHQLTFVITEFVWSIVWCSCWFLQIRLITSKYPSIHVMVWKHLKKFSRGLQVTAPRSQKHNFWRFQNALRGYLVLREYEILKMSISLRLWPQNLCEASYDVSVGLWG